MKSGLGIHLEFIEALGRAVCLLEVRRAYALSLSSASSAMLFRISSCQASANAVMSLQLLMVNASIGIMLCW